MAKKTVSINKWRIILWAAGLLFIGIAIYFGKNFQAARVTGQEINMWAAATSAIPAVLAIGCIVFGFSFKSEGGTFSVSPKTPAGKVIYDKADKPNTLGIYASRTADGINLPEAIRFECVEPEKLLGRPRLCRNNNTFYHVQINNPETDTIKAFELPDAEYVDPAVVAQALVMPCYKRLYRRRVNKWAKYSPWVMGACFMVSLFIFMIVATD